MTRYKQLLLSLLYCFVWVLELSAHTKAVEMHPPKPLYPIPTEAQMAWQKLETYAFIHFGLNTFNDLEWGYGNTPASTFNPKNLDTDQWVRTLKAAGMKGVLLTAKHHDGFCLWPTKTTEYSVKNSPWKGGNGDLVRDLSESCRKYGLKLGLYLSPWDRHHPEYGRAGYQKTFHEQIRELATNYGELFEYWFDGANGGTGWYGGADEKRNINPKEYYRYEEAAEILRANNPDIMIFGGTVPTIRWIGNEAGWAGETNYSTYSLEGERHHTENIWGHRGGKDWLPGEVDVSIRPGWFFHERENHQVRSVANLTNIYYQSVGRNATLLLNFPINLEGKIPAVDSAHAVRWYRHIQKSFSTNLLKGSRVVASNTRLGKTFATTHLIDGNDETYWATEDSAHSAEIIFLLGKKKRFNNLILQEYIRLGQRIEAFEVSVRDSQGRWQPINTADSLTTIGYKRIIRFEPVTSDALRITITKSLAPVTLSEVGLYNASELVDAPNAYRDAENRLIIKPAIDRGGTTNQKLRYRIGREHWQVYTNPVPLPQDHVTVEVEADSGTDRARKVYRFGYSASNFSPKGLTPQQTNDLFDGDGFTYLSLGRHLSTLSIDIKPARLISSILYTPNQQRDAIGHIQAYKLYLDDRLVAEGEFANVKANPVPVEIKLPTPMTAGNLRLEVSRVVDDHAQITIGDLSIY